MRANGAGAEGEENGDVEAKVEAKRVRRMRMVM